jgi:hypothetical protein
MTACLQLQQAKTDESWDALRLEGSGSIPGPTIKRAADARFEPVGSPLLLGVRLPRGVLAGSSSSSPRPRPVSQLCPRPPAGERLPERSVFQEQTNNISADQLISSIVDARASSTRHADNKHSETVAVTLADRSC